METFETVTLEAPVFVNVDGSVLLAPVFTVPKFRLDELGVNAPGELTVRVAAALVTFPAELLTITVNCDLLSVPIVAGVV